MGRLPDQVADAMWLVDLGTFSLQREDGDGIIILHNANNLTRAYIHSSIHTFFAHIALRSVPP
jgi:hypothetical protein